MSYVLYFLFPCYYIFINTVTECERFIFPFSQFCLIIENIRFHIKKKNIQSDHKKNPCWLF